MTIATPSSNDWLRYEAALAHARHVADAPPGTYSDLAVLTACATLMDSHCASDWRKGHRTRAAVLSRVEADQPLTYRIAEALKARGTAGVIGDAVGWLIIFGLTFAALVIFGG